MCELSQFLKSHTVDHWNACKRLLRFLKGTKSTCLCFTTSSNYLETYADAVWASCPDDRRSIGGHCVYFGSNLIVWSSKNKLCQEAMLNPYRSLANATVGVIWLHSLCTKLGIDVVAPHHIWCDNTGAVALALNPVFHARTKHIEVDVHFICEKFLSKFLVVSHVSRVDQIVDIFTKPLSCERFHSLR